MHAGGQTVQKGENRSMIILIFGDLAYFGMTLFRSFWKAQLLDIEDISNFRNVTHEQFQKANY